MDDLDYDAVHQERLREVFKAHDVLVERLKEKTANPDYVEYSISIPPGWTKLVCELDDSLEELNPGYKIVQVKEKFGTLRYYIEPLDSFSMATARIIINIAELESSKTCQRCGEPGELREMGAVITLCDYDYKYHLKMMEEITKDEISKEAKEYWGL